MLLDTSYLSEAKSCCHFLQELNETLQGYFITVTEGMDVFHGKRYKDKKSTAAALLISCMVK